MKKTFQKTLHFPTPYTMSFFGSCYLKKERYMNGRLVGKVKNAPFVELL